MGNQKDLFDGLEATVKAGELKPEDKAENVKSASGNAGGGIPPGFAPPAGE